MSEQPEVEPEPSVVRRQTVTSFRTPNIPFSYEPEEEERIWEASAADIAASLEHDDHMTAAALHARLNQARTERHVNAQRRAIDLENDSLGPRSSLQSPVRGIRSRESVVVTPHVNPVRVRSPGSIAPYVDWQEEYHDDPDERDIVVWEAQMVEAQLRLRPGYGVVPRSASPQALSTGRKRPLGAMRRHRASGSGEEIPLLALEAPPPGRRRVIDPHQLVRLATGGRCFHSNTCSYVQHCPPHMMEVERARQRGFRPCGACNVDALTSAVTIEVEHDWLVPWHDERLPHLCRVAPVRPNDNVGHQ